MTALCEDLKHGPHYLLSVLGVARLLMGPVVFLALRLKWFS